MNDSVAGGKVTALKVQKHHPNRVNVYLEQRVFLWIISHHRCLAAGGSGIKPNENRQATS